MPNPWWSVRWERLVMGSIAIVCLLNALVPALEAQEKPIYNSEPQHLEPISAAESLAQWEVPPSFKVQLFAHEPMVQNPIAMAWDRRGRMWVAENYTYAERAMRFDLALRDRVLILEDRDGDGQAEQRTVFSDSVQMLTSVEVGQGGVWLMCPPQLLFVPDRNEDDVPDSEPVVMLDGFEVARDNYHNFANGLRWGPDGWLYGRCGHSCPAKIGLPGTLDQDRIPMKGGIWRYHPKTRAVEVVVHGTTNPWGHDFDENGEGFFINTVNGHLWHLIHGAHYKESFGAPLNLAVYDRIDTHADHWHFDTKSSWQASRDGKAKDHGGGHAHIGAMIYQGKHLGEEYQGRLMTCNFHGRTINVERLEREGSGYVARHQPNLATAGDPWFRGMEVSQGPDGSIYVLDWSDTGECHDSNGVHRTSGRIYRFYNSERSFEPWQDSLTLQPWERLLDSNEWISRQARIEIAGFQPTSIPAVEIAKLRKLLQASNSRDVLRAMWSLHVLRQLSSGDLLSLLSHKDEHVRVGSLRVLSDHWSIDRADGITPTRDTQIDSQWFTRMTEMARTDPSGLVHLQLVSMLQRFPVDQRLPIAEVLVAQDRYAEDHNLPLLMWYGLIPVAKQNPKGFQHWIEVAKWPTTIECLFRFLAEQADRDSEALNSLLSVAAEKNASSWSSVFSGLEKGFQGRQKVAKPRQWETACARWKSTLKGDALQKFESYETSLSILFGDGRALESIVQQVRNDKAEIAIRVAALKTLLEAKPPELRKICEGLLDVRGLNVLAAKGLATFDDPAIGKTLVAKYGKFLPHERSAVIDVLSQRPSWSLALLDQLASGSIARQDVSSVQARQMQNLNDPQVTQRLREAWGELRDASKEVEQQKQQLRSLLTKEYLSGAQLIRGKALFLKSCGTCHVLYDEGKSLGPNLTGSGRSNLEYLLENILDPSAVVGADYRSTIVAMDDGRVLTGIVMRETDTMVTLRQTEDEVRLPKEEIQTRQLTNKSLMPDQLLERLHSEEIRDLFGYLMHQGTIP